MGLGAAGVPVTPQQQAAAPDRRDARDQDGSRQRWTSCTRRPAAPSVFASSPLQRRLRDVHAITQHFFVAPPTYEMLGKIVLGVEPDGFML